MRYPTHSPVVLLPVEDLKGNPEGIFAFSPRLLLAVLLWHFPPLYYLVSPIRLCPPVRDMSLPTSIVLPRTPEGETVRRFALAQTNVSYWDKDATPIFSENMVFNGLLFKMAGRDNIQPMFADFVANKILGIRSALLLGRCCFEVYQVELLCLQFELPQRYSSLLACTSCTHAVRRDRRGINGLLRSVEPYVCMTYRLDLVRHGFFGVRFGSLSVLV